jgi:hypothetical protein
MEGKCTIFFEDPFWVAVFERADGEGYSTARYVFGAEPGQAELLEFAKQHFQALIFSQPLKLQIPLEKTESYKNRQHRVHRETAQVGIGTKAQQAIQTERERQAAESQACNNAKRSLSETEKRKLKMEQKLQKRRGH